MLLPHQGAQHLEAVQAQKRILSAAEKQLGDAHVAKARSQNRLYEACNQTRLQQAAVAGAQSAGTNLKQQMKVLLEQVILLDQSIALLCYLSKGAPSCHQFGLQSKP